MLHYGLIYKETPNVFLAFGSERRVSLPEEHE